MIEVAEALERETLARTKAGARHVLRVPVIGAIAEDPAMLAIAAAYIGSSALPFRATLFDKSLSANWLVTWHQDTALPVQQRVEAPGWGPWTIKEGVLHVIAPASALEQVIALRVHLDDSTRENGSLRVLPHSHSNGILTKIQIAAMAARVGSVDCVVNAGGVIAMRPLTVHASSKARSEQQRRVIHIEYAPTLDIGSGVTLAS